MLGSVLNVLTNKKYREVLLIGGIIVVCILLLKQCNDAKALQKKNKQNVDALSQSMETVKNKDGEVSFQKSLVVASKKELSELNEEYGELADELKKEKGKVKIITKVEIKYQSDTVEVKNELDSCDVGKYCLGWSVLDSFRTLEGVTSFGINRDSLTLRITPGITTITKDEMLLDLITGIKTIDGIDKIFITPKNPNVKVGNITGAIIENKGGGFINTKNKKKLSIGFHAGYGLVYDSQSNVVRMGPSATIGVSYSLFNF
jgi:hypothetical protein